MTDPTPDLDTDIVANGYPPLAERGLPSHELDTAWYVDREGKGIQRDDDPEGEAWIMVKDKPAPAFADDVEAVSWCVARAEKGDPDALAAVLDHLMASLSACDRLAELLEDAGLEVPAGIIPATPCQDFMAQAHSLLEAENKADLDRLDALFGSAS